MPGPGPRTGPSHPAVHSAVVLGLLLGVAWTGFGLWLATLPWREPCRPGEWMCIVEVLGAMGWVATLLGVLLAVAAWQLRRRSGVAHMVLVGVAVAFGLAALWWGLGKQTADGWGIAAAIAGLPLVLLALLVSRPVREWVRSPPAADEAAV